MNAREESTGKSKNIKIKNEKGRLNKSEIDKMIADAEKYKEEDENCKRRISSRNLLESYLFSIRSAYKEYGSKLNEKDRASLEKLANENISWLEANREQDAAIYEDKFKVLQHLIMPIMSKIHKKTPNGTSSAISNSSSATEQDGPKIEELN